jgi:cold shock protein
VIEKMSTGRILQYDEVRRFGFIIPDGGGADVFVHANYVVNADALKKDQRVSFDVVNDDRRGKPRADNVRIIEGRTPKDTPFSDGSPFSGGAGWASL